MKQIWFKLLLGVFVAAGLCMGMLVSAKQAEAYQTDFTPPGVYVTVIYPDPINVRGGPSTVHYPIVGQLSPGAVVPALGVSPGHEWVQISFPQSPTGTGWVYAVFVTVSGGELQIVEPPPTSTPLVSPTIDLTLAAAFSVQPTQTRLPTFTPPPPLMVPSFTETRGLGSGSIFGVFILGLGLIGGIGLLVSFVLRK